MDNLCCYCGAESGDKEECSFCEPLVEALDELAAAESAGLGKDGLEGALDGILERLRSRAGRNMFGEVD